MDCSSRHLVRCVVRFNWRKLNSKHDGYMSNSDTNIDANNNVNSDSYTNCDSNCNPNSYSDFNI